MKIEPIRRYATPQLPTREIVDESPELLRLLPKRWQANPAVVAALAACLAMSSCANGAADKASSGATSRVAPIFKHGEGRAAFGGMTTSPPAMLSEDEARNIIVGEAKKAGIVFRNDGTVLPTEVELPLLPVAKFHVRVLSADGEPVSGANEPPAKPERQTKTHRIVLDGNDAKRHIAFEFVTSADLLEWEGDPRKATFSTVYEHDLLKTAEDLREGIAKAAPAGTYAVFYDPVVGPFDVVNKYGYKPHLGKTVADREKEQAKVDAMAKAFSREELRAQVKDFIKWLKAQGVI